MILAPSNAEFLPSYQNDVQFHSLACQSGKKLSAVIGQIAYAILLPLNLLFNNISVTASVLKKISRNILPMIDPNQYIELRTVLESSVSLISSIQIAIDIDYLVNSRFRNDTNATIVGRFFRFIARIGECLLWMAQDGFINIQKIPILSEIKIFAFVPRLLTNIPFLKANESFQKIAEAMGNFRFFSFITKITLNSVINSSMAIYHFVSTAECCKKMHEAESPYQQQYQFIKTGKHFTEFSLSFMMAGNFLNGFPIAILSMCCIGMEFASLIYKECYEGR